MVPVPHNLLQDANTDLVSFVPLVILSNKDSVAGVTRPEPVDAPVQTRSKSFARRQGDTLKIVNRTQDGRLQCI